jgi:beta-galactosidase
MEKILQGDKILLGVCYYPEHWDKSLWKEDLKRMKDHGLEAVRIAEFAWNLSEPSEGNFNFDFFDRFLEEARAASMSVIFGTPTATPPAWLTHKYPEALNARIDGVLYRHGSRRHYNYNSKVYQELSARIVEKIAGHYGKHPAIIGWQIDNEVNCELDEFYSESDSIAFREFLKDKYQSLAALNDAWGTVFWNQTYTAWEEVFVPRLTINASVNPHEVMDYTRFISHSARKFVKMQSNIIEKYKKNGDFITTNGMFSNLDNHRMVKESLDFFTYDSYPNFAYCLDREPWAGSSGLKDRMWSRNLSHVRSVSNRFGIMEQQSGPNGWNTRMEAPAPRPGQMSLWTMQSIAHGADYVSYFRWRTAPFGTEIYWHGILDYSNRDNRRIAELDDIHEKVTRISAAAGARYHAAFGVLEDYDNQWDVRLDAWHRRVHQISDEGIFIAANFCTVPLIMFPWATAPIPPPCRRWKRSPGILCFSIPIPRL